MQMYSEADVDRSVLDDKKIAVLGYGSQGRAHSRNLKDSGFDLVVGLRKDGKSWDKAVADGMTVQEPQEAATGAAIVMFLTPDLVQASLYSAVESSLDAMTDNELASTKLHEIGEVMAGELLGEDWETMLASIPHSKAEIMVRAVRDHLADALSTLPGLLTDMNAASLHFYIANLTNMRKDLFPRLVAAYEIWTVSGNTQEFERLVGEAAVHWQMLSEKMLGVYREQGNECQPAMISLIEAHSL